MYKSIKTTLLITTALPLPASCLMICLKSTCFFSGQVAEDDGDQGQGDHSPALAKPVCVNGTEPGSLNNKAKAERRSSSSSNPSRKGVSTASKIRKLSTCKQQWAAAGLQKEAHLVSMQTGKARCVEKNCSLNKKCVGEQEGRLHVKIH